MGFVIRTKGHGCGQIDKVDKSSLVCLNCQCSSHDAENYFMVIDYLDWWEEWYGPSPKSESKGVSSAHAKTSTSRSSPAILEVEGGSCKCYYCNGVDGLKGASPTPATTTTLPDFNVA